MKYFLQSKLSGGHLLEACISEKNVKKKLLIFWPRLCGLAFIRAWELLLELLWYCQATDNHSAE